MTHPPFKKIIISLGIMKQTLTPITDYLLHLLNDLPQGFKAGAPPQSAYVFASNVALISKLKLANTGTYSYNFSEFVRKVIDS